LKECIDEVNQDFQKLHCCLGRKRKHLEILGLQIASNKAEELILEQSIQAKKKCLENLTIKEKKIKRNLSVAAMFDKASDQISEIEATAEYTQDQMEGLEGLEEEVSSLKEQVEELREVVKRTKKKAKKDTM
jgi:chromosome segregation ATPase